MADFQYTPFFWLYLSGFATTVILAIVSWRMQPVRGALNFSLVPMALACWFAGNILGFYSTDLDWKVFSVRIEYLGIVLAPVFVYLFATRYVQLKVPGRWEMILFIPAALTYLAVLTFPLHKLFYTAYGIETLESGLVIFDRAYGPLFYFWMILSYAIVVTSAVILFRGSSRMPGSHRSQATIIGLITALIIVANTMFVSGFNPIAPYDPTPLTFLVACLLILVNMRVFHFLNVVPVAHNQVFNQVPTGVIVLNERDNVIDANEPAKAIFAPSEVIGEPIEHLVALGDGASQQEVTLGENRRIYDIDVTPLSDDRQQVTGRILLFHDVTDRILMTLQQDELITRLKQASNEVKMLEGILPVCANCKNIKDDDGNWQTMETYFKARSTAEFSHGICPVCYEKLYGNLGQ